MNTATKLSAAAALAVLGLLPVAVSGCRSASGVTAGDKRADVQRMRSETLDRLARELPDAHRKLPGAKGYGVFSTLGMKLLVASGSGFGVVRDNATGQDTYMKMREVGLGLGLGVKDTRIVIVFYDAATMHTFTESGWEWGGDADAAAKYQHQGATANVGVNALGGMEAYVLTEAGIALHATVSGTKYWKDEELNER